MAYAEHYCKPGVTSGYPITLPAKGAGKGSAARGRARGAPPKLRGMRGERVPVAARKGY